MVKKIKKYLKFVVCCALIMSLVAPSYAALSASDGSAFVTKAEFDAALADFNSRLTTFEAGINSKIDSQVTSYLDRNGIWNGKAQPLSASSYKFNVCEMFNIPVSSRAQLTGTKYIGSPPNATSGSSSGGWSTTSWADLKRNMNAIGFADSEFTGYVTYRPSSTTGGSKWFVECALASEGGATATAAFPQILFEATKAGLVFMPIEQTMEEFTLLQWSYPAGKMFYADHVDSVDLGYSITVNNEVRARRSLYSLRVTGSDYFSATSKQDTFYGLTSGTYGGGAKAFPFPILKYSSTELFFVNKGDQVALCAAPIIANSHDGFPCTWSVNSVLNTGDARNNSDWLKYWEFQFPRGINVY